MMVVVLPLVPLTAITDFSRKWPANSNSPQTGTPAFRAACSHASSGGTPGLRMIRSESRQAGFWLRAVPKASVTPRPAIFRRASSRASGGAWSVTVTRAPLAARKRHKATPVRARPTTRTFF